MRFRGTARSGLCPRVVALFAWLAAFGAPASTEAAAQTTRQGRTGPGIVAVQAGIGAGTAGWTVPLVGTVGFGGHLVSARFSNTDAQLLEGGRALRELGVLYGRTLAPASPRVSAAAGLGAVRCEDIEGCGAKDPHGNLQSHRTVMGVPIEAQISLPLTGFFGIGLYGFGNLNAMESFFGAAVALQLGKLR
jgi:hypothetical protein